MSLVDEEMYDSILLEFSKEKKQVERVQKERARKAIIDSPEIYNMNTVEVAKKENISDKTISEIKDVVKENIKIVSLSDKEKSKDVLSEDSSKVEASTPIRKLKKINISDIADKIQKNTKLCCKN